jgi:hypothetical protein
MASGSRIALAALLVTSVIVGCSEEQPTGQRVSSEDRIKQIQSNTHMPENIKKMAIDQIKAGQRPGGANRSSQ